MALAPKKESVANKQEEKLFNELLQLLNKMSIEVKYARGHFMGGLVRYRGQQFLYLNRAAKTQAKINVILNELQYIQIPWNEINQDLARYIKQEITRQESQKND